MAGLSYPFDAGPGSTVTEDQWSYLMRDAVGTGVHEAGTTSGPLSSELKITSLAEAGIMHIGAGRASISGFHYQQGAADIIAVTANSNPTQDRIDAAVLRLDLNTNAITLEVKLGVPNNTPVPPAIASNELLLATFKVRKNTNTVLSNEVTDKRLFVGRRMSVTDQGGIGKEGDIQYSPTLDTWFGVVNGGFTEQFAFQADLSAHISAPDPHPQYMTQAETNTTVTAAGFTADPTMSTFASYHRSLNLPGGFKVVMFYFYGKFNGVDNPSAFTMFTMNDVSLRPNFTFRYVGHQWKFANSTDDIPLIVTINPDGTCQGGGATYLMGGANVLVNGIYFKGTGV